MRSMSYLSRRTPAGYAPGANEPATISETRRRRDRVASRVASELRVFVVAPFAGRSPPAKGAEERLTVDSQGEDHPRQLGDRAVPYPRRPAARTRGRATPAWSSRAGRRRESGRCRPSRTVVVFTSMRDGLAREIVLLLGGACPRVDPRTGFLPDEFTDVQQLAEQAGELLRAEQPWIGALEEFPPSLEHLATTAGGVIGSRRRASSMSAATWEKRSFRAGTRQTTSRTGAADRVPRVRRRGSEPRPSDGPREPSTRRRGREGGARHGYRRPRERRPRRSKRLSVRRGSLSGPRRPLRERPRRRAGCGRSSLVRFRHIVVLLVVSERRLELRLILLLLGLGFLDATGPPTGSRPVTSRGSVGRPERPCPRRSDARHALRVDTVRSRFRSGRIFGHGIQEE